MVCFHVSEGDLRDEKERAEAIMRFWSEDPPKGIFLEGEILEAFMLLVECANGQMAC